jgi:hypothetical protein
MYIIRFVNTEVFETVKNNLNVQIIKLSRLGLNDFSLFLV